MSIGRPIGDMTAPIEEVAEPVVVAPVVPAAPEPFDPLTSEIDDPVFAMPESYKGLPSQADAIKALPEDTKQLVHNLRIGARQAVADSTEKVKAADARSTAADEARVKAETERDELLARFKAQAPAVPLADDAANLLFRRLTGMEDGDPFEGVTVVDPLDTVDTTVSEETMMDPVKLTAMFVALKDAAKASTTVKAKAFAQHAARGLAQPSLAAQKAQEATAAEVATANVLAAYHALPGMDNEAHRAEVDAVMNRFDPDGTRFVGLDGLKAGHAIWLANGGAAKVVSAPPVPAPAATPATPGVTITPAPTPEADPLALFMAMGERAAQAASGRGGHGQGELIAKEPDGLTPSQHSDWLDKNPIVKAMLERNEAGAGKYLGRPA